MVLGYYIFIKRQVGFLGYFSALPYSYEYAKAATTSKKIKKYRINYWAKKE